MDSQEFYSILSSAVQWSQVDDHYAILIMLNEGSQGRDKLCFSLLGKKAAKDGVVYRISKALHSLMDLMQALWVHYVVADHVAFLLAHAIYLVKKGGYCSISPENARARRRLCTSSTLR